MILLHKEELTIDSFCYDQFGENSRQESSMEGTGEGQDIVLPSFDQEEVEEVVEEILAQESEAKLPDEPAKSDLLLRELEKREAQLREKEKKVLDEAQKKADEIIGQAQIDAEEIKKNTFDQASEEGYKDGYKKAYEEHKAKMDEEIAVFLIQVRDMIQSYEEEKALLISQNIDELKELAIAIAEKVIQISLKTSGEIIKKMIVTATSKMKYKEWVKIYISKRDSALIVESNADLIDAISHLSEHIKIIVMEDSAPGTCIIELPDQIIDASASTQIENIRAIMKSSGKLGGNDIV